MRGLTTEESNSLKKELSALNRRFGERRSKTRKQFKTDMKAARVNRNLAYASIEKDRVKEREATIARYVKVEEVKPQLLHL